MEIIFVSSDKDEKAFKEYLKEMPWHAIPYSDRDRKNRLSSKFKVNGIPSFVILEPNGELITDGGRAEVMRDPKGAQLPWRPKSPLEMLSSGKFITTDGSVKTFEEATKGREAVGLYFSASVCRNCIVFNKKNYDGKTNE